MSDKTYNGWPNWETWNTFNWLSSDEGMWYHAQRYARNDNLKEFVESFEEDYLKGNASLIHDFWRAGLHQVDWEELTRVIADDEEEEEDE